MNISSFRKLFPLVIVVGATAALADTAPVTSSTAPAPIGRVQISTIPFDPNLSFRTATYTPSGKVLVSYAENDRADRNLVTLAVMDDDGKNMRPVFSRIVPPREKDNGIRFMVFPDNKRIFLGDYIIECAPSIDRCDKSQLLPVNYPAEVDTGAHVGHRWSEIIVAPDNRHIAWTTLLANYSAVVFTGELRKEGAAYKIQNTRIVSTMDPFVKDPKHPDGVNPQTLRGGEVKQFVYGGTALSLAGAIKRDLPDSVVQHLESGEMEAITDTPGYTETTIFSPDERLGVTMTTRFSKATDLAVLGLMPRPYPTSLNMGLSMAAYTYGVTGVRSARPGNIGPALIDIQASKAQDGYLGANLNTQDDWVFHSPLSWHPSSKKALWIEGQRGTRNKRMQVVTLPDYKAGAAVAARPTPNAVPYGSSDLSVIPGLVNKTQDIDVKVYGRASGHIEYRRSAASIEKTYVNFSDDGKSVYAGRETMQVNPRGNSTYTADVRLTGDKPGVMNLKMTFGPLSGSPAAKLIFDPDASGTPQSGGYTEYAGQRLNVADLLP